MKNRLHRLFESLQKEGVAKTAGKIAFKLKKRLNQNQNSYVGWIKKHGSNKIDIGSLDYTPLISVIMPTYNTKLEWLKEAVESVKSQSYQNWELCIVDDASSNSGVVRSVREFAKNDKRVKVKFRDTNGHIATASNDALQMTEGEWVVLLDHDDKLAVDALFWLVAELNKNPQSDMLYSDEDKLKNGKRVLPFFKPDWSPHLALSQAYLGHIVCIRKSVMNEIGGFDTNLSGAQDYDLWLRASTVAKEISHIPKILYHWRMHEESTALSADSKPYAHDAGKKAVNKYLAAKYPKHNIEAVDGEQLFTYKMRFGFEQQPLVSIIIPTKDKVELLRPCIESITKLSLWQNFEIIIIDNNSIEVETASYLQSVTSADTRIKVVNAPIEFNWSKLNNLGVQNAKGSFFIFLNNDTVVISKEWIEQLVVFAGCRNCGRTIDV